MTNIIIYMYMYNVFEDCYSLVEGYSTAIYTGTNII